MAVVPAQIELAGSIVGLLTGSEFAVIVIGQEVEVLPPEVVATTL